MPWPSCLGWLRGESGLIHGRRNGRFWVAHGIEHNYLFPDMLEFGVAVQLQIRFKTSIVLTASESIYA